jgi:hypothetical protein
MVANFSLQRYGVEKRRALASPACRGEAPCTLGDARHDAIEVTEHLMLRNPHHLPTEIVERAIPRAIVTRALLVVRPINLDDEPHLGAREVDDVLADDELPPKRKPGLGPREPAPEPLLRARWRAPVLARNAIRASRSRE